METYTGHVRTPNDAIILFEACRIGQLPRVQRRLSEKERQQIKSGSVFVWDEREAGMRRWTDGKSWSASRVSGSFLTYREMEGKRGGSGFSGPSPGSKKAGAKNAETGKTNDSDEDGPDGYRYKPDGLMKQSFSITTANGQHLHLISYYSRSQSASQNLMMPSNDPSLRHIRPQKGMYPETTVNESSNVPAVTRGPMPGSPYANSPHAMSAGSPYTRPTPGGHPYAHSSPAYSTQQWPPSPMPTPPSHYSPYHPMPGSVPPGHSPHQYPYHHPYGYAHSPSMTVFDRAPPPLSSSALPPPPPQVGAPPPAPPPVHYIPQNVRPPPDQSQAHPLHANPYAQNLDPRLTGALPPTSVPEQPTQNGASPHLFPHGPSSAGLANGIRHEPSPAAPPQGSIASITNYAQASESLSVPDANGPTTNGSQPSKVIPSIGALINGDRTEASSDARSDRSGSRGGSRSPKSNVPRSEQDHSGKTSYGEDQRVIRQLDRAFAA